MISRSVQRARLQPAPPRRAVGGRVERTLERRHQRPVWPKPPPRLAPSRSSTSTHVDVLDRLDHELCDAVAPVDLVRELGIRVEQDHLELVPIPGVDQPGRVHDGDARPEREPAPGQDEPGVALRDGDREARRHERPTPARREHRTLAGGEIDPGVAGFGVCGQREIRVEPDDGDGEHASRLRASRPPCPVDQLDRRRVSLVACSSGWTSR